MEVTPETGYEIEIDGDVIGYEAVFEAAKARAVAAANGVASMKIMRQGGVRNAADGADIPVPDEAWCWDYEAQVWIQAPSPATCHAKRNAK
jgi:hypothetical protein